MANYVLEILDGDRAGEVLSVGERTLRIGRKPGNDLVLADEKTSGVHCEIAPEGDRLVLRDLGSTNGTFLDGKRVTEIVLTPGDVVTVGRLRVKFRGADDAKAEHGGEFAVRKLDATRLARRGSSVGLLAVLLVLVLGGAGWFWWQGRGASKGGDDAPQRRSPLVVAGNKLAAELASCESDAGFELRAAGVGFRPAVAAHTGAGCFAASRDDGGGGEDFAVLRLTEAITVFPGRSLTVAAHCRTRGSAQMTVRAVVFANAGAEGGAPFRFCSGAALASHDDWQRVETVAVVPAGCDRLLVEVVAVLPDGDAEAQVDDLAVTEGGTGVAFDARLDESGQQALGFGASLAVRSTDNDNPATLLAVLPETVPAALRGLAAAELCTLSDLGATLSCTAADKSFAIAATGAGALQFVFPADAAGGLLVAADGDGAFGSAAAESEFTAARVLVGARATRALLHFPGPTALVGRIGGGRYRLAAQSAGVELQLGFRAEKQTALELLRRAQAARDDGQPGRALDALRELAQTAPMDSDVLQQAQALRGELLAQQSATLRDLQRDLEEADFFRTRGGFERVVAGVDQLFAHYDARNLEDAAGAEALRADAQQRLLALDKAQQGPERQRLTDLAEAFAATKQPALERLVQGYLERHVPAATPATGRDGEDGGK